MKIRKLHVDKAAEIWDYEDAYKPLIRHLKKNWFNQIHFDNPERELLGYIAHGMGNYSGAIKVYNIYRFCQTHFGGEELSENNLVGIAYCLYKYHKKALTKKIESTITESYEKDRIKVFREFVSRGFVPRDCIKNIDLRNDHYIQANTGALIYDKPFSNQQEADEFRSKWGVYGWCGIISPKS